MDVSRMTLSLGSGGFVTMSKDEMAVDCIDAGTESRDEAYPFVKGGSTDARPVCIIPGGGVASCCLEARGVRIWGSNAKAGGTCG